MSQTAEEARNYLDPAVLAKITGLELRARLLAQGFISGRHRSPLHGFSVEFAEHRKYCQGDDLRFIDWKVFARTDKHYLKQYDQETNLQLLLVVDCSESMGYQSTPAGLSKRQYATTLAAAFAYLTLHQGDAVGVATFDTTLRRVVRPSGNPAQWKLVVQELLQEEAAGRTLFRPVFDELAESLSRRHLVVILSDFLGELDDIVMGLKHLRYRRHEPIVLQILDHAELTFPFSGATRFVGMEDGGTLMVDPRAMRERYLHEVRSFTDALRRQCHALRADYETLDTSALLSTALTALLTTRAARTRRWR